MASNINNQDLINSTLAADLSTPTTSSSSSSNRWRLCRWCSSSNRWTLMSLTCTKGFSLTRRKASSSNSPCLTLRQCTCRAAASQWITFKCLLMVLLIRWWTTWTTCNSQAKANPPRASHSCPWSLQAGQRLLTWPTNRHLLKTLTSTLCSRKGTTRWSQWLVTAVTTHSKIWSSRRPSQRCCPSSTLSRLPASPVTHLE